jgi:hypothetical protein
MTTRPKTIEDYDSERFGPMLGVSDEGSAAPTIARAAHASAKAKALGNADESCVGVIIDGERMGSAGELPIGPDEYAQVLPAATGSTFCSTNVGVRVNTRIYQPLPEFRVADAGANEQAWLDSIFAKFEPFIHTPDEEPRPMTVRLLTESRACHDALRKLVPKLEQGRKSGRLGSPEVHHLTFLIRFEDEITSTEEIAEIRQLMQLASELNVPEVAVDGKLVEAARRRISIQGLLNVLAPGTARSLLGEAKKLGVRVTYHYEHDRESAARTIWTGLSSARHEGLTAAKYGLFPLTFEQQQHVVEQVQRWTRGWTAIPAFYVDTALVTEDDVFESDRCMEACKMWMSMVAAREAKVVLIDCPDRVDPHRLLQILSPEEVGTLVEHADELGLKALWSGGIQPDQAYALAKRGVAGIFTTGSTARRVAVHGALTGDKQLAAQAQPTELGVRRIHALVQGGFLFSRLEDPQITQEIEARSAPLVDKATRGRELAAALQSFDETLMRGWKKHWS